MRKTIVISIVILLFVCCLSSCGNSKEVHVKTMEAFYEACTDSQDKGTETIILDADLVWDRSYNGGDGKPFKADVTGVTIDLNGHTISDVTSKAFVLMGTNITVKNGTITAFAGNNRYALNFNWVDTDSIGDGNYLQFREKAQAAKPASFDDSDELWKNRIVVEDMVIEGLGCAYTPIEIRNTTIQNAPYKGICLWGASGILENVVSESLADTAVSVANWAYVIVKGTGHFKGTSNALYCVDGGICEFASDAVYTLSNFSADASKVIYANKKAAIILGDSTTVESFFGKKTIAVNAGSYIEIAKGTKITNMGEEIGNITGYYSASCDWINWSSTANVDLDTPVYEGQTDFSRAYINDLR